MPDANSPDPPPPAEPAEPELYGLDPGELLARGLHAVEPPVKAGPWQPPTPEELGRLLPEYRIERLLGRGGMGAVYKGVQPELERPVAIKILPAEMAADEQFVARFRREARTLAKLQHSRIITIHDFGQTSDGHLYFVMEYIDGTNLRDILKGPGLTAEQALLAVSQVCDALYAAHKQGVIHRDIKPENVLITGDGYVKLADFGLARPREEKDAEVVTSAHTVMGTPAYMAPEQRAGHADHRSDIYALGVMLYEMLTGRRPEGAFDPPSFKVQVDIRLDRVVLKALRQEPERRYQEVSELKKDVDTIRSTPQPQAAVQKPHDAGGWLERLSHTLLHRWHVSAAVTVLLLVGLGGAVWQRRIISPPAPAFVAQQVPPAANQEPPAPVKEASVLGGLDSNLSSVLPNGTPVPRPTLTVLPTFQPQPPVLPLISRDEHGSRPLLGAGVWTDMLKRAGNEFRNDMISWTRTANGIEARRIDNYGKGSIYAGSVSVPLPADSNYALEVEFTPASADSRIGITIPLGGGQRTTCWVEGRRGMAGLGKVDGKDPYEKDTVPGCGTTFKLQPGRRYLAHTEVRTIPEGTEIRFSIDLTLVGSYRGALNRLSVSTCWNKYGNPQAADLSTADPAVFHTARIKLFDNARLLADVSPPSLESTLRKAGWSRFQVSVLADGTEGLRLNGSGVSDLSPLTGTRISEFYAGGNPITDLRPLSDLPLRTICLGYTPVMDLAPLGRLPLESLCLSHTSITNLAPLRGMKLRMLFIDGDKEEVDLAPLAQIISLENILLPSKHKNLELLRKLPNLKFINYTTTGSHGAGSNYPAAKFWADYDAKMKSPHSN